MSLVSQQYQRKSEALRQRAKQFGWKVNKHIKRAKINKSLMRITVKLVANDLVGRERQFVNYIYYINI